MQLECSQTAVRSTTLCIICIKILRDGGSEKSALVHHLHRLQDALCTRRSRNTMRSCEDASLFCPLPRAIISTHTYIFCAFCYRITFYAPCAAAAQRDWRIIQSKCGIDRRLLKKRMQQASCSSSSTVAVRRRVELELEVS